MDGLTDGQRRDVAGMINAEEERIGIFADEREGLRETRLNFEWLDAQRKNAEAIKLNFDWVTEQRKRSEEGRAEFRKAFLGKSAEWLWHILSAAAAGAVTYFFSTRGHS
jgi:hypothetical protein